MKQQKSYIPVDFSQYKQTYSEELKGKFINGLYMSIEEVRQLMYGALVTDVEVDGEIFELDYWNEMENNLEEELMYAEDGEKQNREKTRLMLSIPGIRLSIITALLSSGDGLTPESAITVVAVQQEYEIAEHLGVPRKYCICQSLQQINGKQYDCLEFDTNPRDIKRLYFDVTMLMKQY